MPRAAKAIELLQKLPKADLIICASQIGHENSGLEIYKYLQKFERNIKMLVMGYQKLLEKKVYMTKEIDDWKEVIRKSAQILGISPRTMSKAVLPDFYPLDLKYFQSVNSVGCDVYIRIQKGKKAGDYQYIKRFRSSEHYDHEIIQKYRKYGVTHLFVPKANRLLFAKHFSDEIVRKLKLEDAKAEEVISVQSDAFYVFSDMIRTSGLDEESIKLAQATINSMGKTVERIPQLKTLMEHLRKNKEGFIFNHSILIAYLGNYVLSNMMMGTKESRHTFTFVAFFHDCMLSDEEFAKIHSEKQIKELDLELDEKAKILRHAADACELLRKYPDVPMNAPMAIKQHHCSLDGITFVDFPSERVTPLAQVFHVVETYATFLLEEGDDPKKRNECIKALQKKYDKAYFKETVDILASL